MRILIEEYGYDISNQPNKELVALLQKVLYGIGVDKTQTIEGKLSISYVGYFYNPDIQDCVFILPKVVIDGQDNVLGDSNISPWDLLDKGLTALKDEQRKFIYEFAVWIYRAIVVYNKDNKDNKANHHKAFDNRLEYLFPSYLFHSVVYNLFLAIVTG